MVQHLDGDLTSPKQNKSVARRSRSSVIPRKLFTNKRKEIGPLRVTPEMVERMDWKHSYRGGKHEPRYRYISENLITRSKKRSREDEDPELDPCCNCTTAENRELCRDVTEILRKDHFKGFMEVNQHPTNSHPEESEPEKADKSLNSQEMEELMEHIYREFEKEPMEDNRKKQRKQIKAKSKASSESNMDWQDTTESETRSGIKVKLRIRRGRKLDTKKAFIEK